ncbi:hypothetical protein NGRA_1429 [Nosema granulosis]|uniref:Uncharacterized protein n=1 Tax=Nosema granulosis TaxID=83296 RepID=A0A9P6GYG4_9MICR|nr:hypothetical protein NGRA_1429 [Nosema granulosis]
MDLISTAFYFITGFFDGFPMSKNVQSDAYFITGLASCFITLLASFIMWITKLELHSKTVRICLCTTIGLYFLSYVLYMLLESEIIFCVTKSLLFLFSHYFGILGVCRSDENVFDYTIYAIPVLLGNYAAKSLFNGTPYNYQAFVMIAFMGLVCACAMGLLKYYDVRTKINQFTPKLNKSTTLFTILIGMLGAGAASSRVFYYLIPMHTMATDSFITTIACIFVLSGNYLYYLKKKAFYIVGIAFSIYNFEEIFNLFFGTSENKIFAFGLFHGYISLIVFKFLSMSCRAKEYNLIHIYMISRSLMMMVSLSIMYFVPGCGFVVLSCFINLLGGLKMAKFGNRIKEKFSEYKQTLLENNDKDTKTTEKWEVEMCDIQPTIQVATEETPEGMSEGIYERMSEGRSSNVYEDVSALRTSGASSRQSSSYSSKASRQSGYEVPRPSLRSSCRRASTHSKQCSQSKNC